MKAFYAFLLILCPYCTGAQTSRHTVANADTVTPAYAPMVNSKSSTNKFVNGKSQTIIQPLAIGDKVPDITFTQMVNSKWQTINLAAFKGKLVILDFWATWCSACTRKFNFLDSMLQRYPGQLQVILVNQARTKDNKQKIEKFFGRQRSSTGSTLILPTVYNDTIAGAYFPNKAIPHYVWISPTGHFLGATGPDELTAKNLLAAINGKAPVLAGLFLMDSFNGNKPLFVKGNAGNGEAIRFRSTLSNYIPGLGSFAHITHNKENLVTGYKMINTPLLLMLTRAYSYYSRHDRILLAVSDSIKDCLFPPNDSINRANTFTYEFITPPIPSKALSPFIAQDLERWFGLVAKYEFREAPVYLLTVDTLLLSSYRTAGAKRSDHLNDPDSSYIVNGTLSTLTEYLDYRLDRFVLQQDSINYDLDLILPQRPGNDCTAYIASLASMGIILTPATKPVRRFIIYQLPKQ